MPDNTFDLDDIEIEDSLLISKLNEIIENVELLKSSYLEMIHAESLTDITQQQYSGFLMYCAMNYFRPTKVLLQTTPIQKMQYANISKYNDKLLVLVCEYYIFMSFQYNKVVNGYGFSLFIGCDFDNITRWSKDENQRPELSGMIKRLRILYEKSLENGAQSGKNPVGFIAALNHHFNWSADNKPSLTVNINRSQEQIMSTFDSSLIENKS